MESHFEIPLRHFCICGCKKIDLRNDHLEESKTWDWTNKGTLFFLKNIMEQVKRLLTTNDTNFIERVGYKLLWKIWSIIKMGWLKHWLCSERIKSLRHVRLQKIEIFSLRKKYLGRLFVCWFRLQKYQVWAFQNYRKLNKSSQHSQRAHS